MHTQQCRTDLQFASCPVQAYHAGTIRTLLFTKADTTTGYGAKISTIVGAISALRGKAGGGKDQGIIRKGGANIVPTNGVPFAFPPCPTFCAHFVCAHAHNTHITTASMTHAKKGPRQGQVHTLGVLAKARHRVDAISHKRLLPRKTVMTGQHGGLGCR